MKYESKLSDAVLRISINQANVDLPAGLSKAPRRGYLETE
jgi:hypothetical protein